MNHIRKLLVGLALAACGSNAAAQAVHSFRGFCENGGQVVVTSGMSSFTKVQRSYPACTVKVFIHGSSPPTLASIYSDDVGTVLANPFTAHADGSWQWYGDGGRYDVEFSGAGITLPYTWWDLSSGGAGSGMSFPGAGIVKSTGTAWATSLADPLTVAHGGTGLSTIASGSILAANTANTLSAITSTSGSKVLTNTSGTIAWSVPTSYVAGAAGSTTWVQYNTAGNFDASSDFTFNHGTHVLTLGYNTTDYTGFTVDNTGSLTISPTTAPVSPSALVSGTYYSISTVGTTTDWNSAAYPITVSTPYYVGEVFRATTTVSGDGYAVPIGVASTTISSDLKIAGKPGYFRDVTALGIVPNSSGAAAANSTLIAQIIEESMAVSSPSGQEGILYFPRGNYWFTDGISIHASFAGQGGIFLVGDPGQESIIIRETAGPVITYGSQSAHIVWSGTDGTVTRWLLTGGGVRDLTLENVDTSYDPTTVGLKIDGVSFGEFSNITGIGSKADRWGLRFVIDSEWESWTRIDNIRSDGTASAIIYNMYSGAQTLFTNIRAPGYATAAVWFEGRYWGDHIVSNVQSQGSSYTITSTSGAVVNTSSYHGFYTGDVITIICMAHDGYTCGDGTINGTWKITRVSNTAFTLDGASGLSCTSSGVVKCGDTLAPAAVYFRASALPTVPIVGNSDYDRMVSVVDVDADVYNGYAVKLEQVDSTVYNRINASGIVYAYAMPWSTTNLPFYSNYSGAKEITLMSSVGSWLMSKLFVGDYMTSASIDSWITVNKLFDSTLAINGHAFSDSSTINRAPWTDPDTRLLTKAAFNSYDSRGTITGTYNYDHHAGFQAGEIYSSTGTIDNLYGFVSILSQSHGTINNLATVEAFELAESGGTVVNQDGVHIRELTVGTGSNYGVLTDGGTRSYFTGTIFTGNYGWATIPNDIPRDTTKNTSGNGTHTSTTSAILMDSTMPRAWSTNQWAGYYIYNTTTSQRGLISSNTSDTITALQAGSVAMTWHNGDGYRVEEAVGLYTGGEGWFLNGLDTNRIIFGQNSAHYGEIKFTSKGDVSIVSFPTAWGKGGFLPPVMDTTARTAIASPAEGVMVYDTTTHKLYVFDGTVWQAAW